MSYAKATVVIPARGIFTAVEVEASVMKGPPGFSAIGLPESVANDAWIHFRCAAGQAGFVFPVDHAVVVNVVPPMRSFERVRDLDLSIIAAILGACGQINLEKFGPHQLTGELALDGRVRGNHYIHHLKEFRA